MMFPEKYLRAVVGLELRSQDYKSETLSTQPPDLIHIWKFFSIDLADCMHPKIKLKPELLHILKRAAKYPSNLMAELIEWQTCNSETWVQDPPLP